MIVTAWKAGKHNKTGTGYGLKIKIKDRDKYFKKHLKTVILELEGYPEPVEVNIDKFSFWNSICHELISKEIGKWLIKNGFAPWPKYNPPKLSLEPLSHNRFVVTKPVMKG